MHLLYCQKFHTGKNKLIAVTFFIFYLVFFFIIYFATAYTIFMEYVLWNVAYYWKYQNCKVEVILGVRKAPVQNNCAIHTNCT